MRAPRVFILPTLTAILMPAKSITGSLSVKHRWLLLRCLGKGATLCSAPALGMPQVSNVSIGHLAILLAHHALLRNIFSLGKAPMLLTLQIAELAKERDFAVASKHAAAEAAAGLETRARATAEQHRADIKALQSQISQLKVFNTLLALKSALPHIQ